MAADIGFQIEAILSEYNEEVQAKVNDAIQSVSKEAVKKLRSDSPKEEGEYAKGWTSKIEKSHGSVSATIYNKAKPGLAHLLENGHAKVGGGRVSPKTHIKPVEEWANNELIREIERAL